ncbi:MAG: TatD family hydrolase [Myxococcaceae bacterium]
MKLIDAHCHLERREGVDVSAIIQRAKEAGVIHAVIVGQFHGNGDFGSTMEVAAAHADYLTPTMGIHPHDAAKANAQDFELLRSICSRPEVKAVGEAGLDYYYDHSPRDEQQVMFRKQCELAVELGKPLVVHVRDAHEDCARIMKETGIRRGQIHCFTGDTDNARAYLDLGFVISVSGVVTYKKTEALQAAVAFTPIDRLLVETDSPFLAPVPYRGKKNEPGFVVETAKKIAELKKVSPEEVALATTRNAASLFGISTDPA